MIKEEIRVSFEDLRVIPCHAKNKRKMKTSVFDKLRLKMIPVFYEKLGYIFRSADNPKEYYSMEQLQELFKRYIKNKTI